MTKPPIRTALVVAAPVFAIAAPAIQSAMGLGLSASEFSRQGDGTLRAAGYAFSIWGVIYAGLAIYAVWQALPRTPESPLLRAVAWPSVIGIAGCGLWIFISALNWRWATVAVIAASTAAIIFALWRAASETERGRIVLWPLGLLGGWLTAATALNLLTIMTAEGLIAPAQATTAAIAGLSGVAAVALAVIARTRSAPYAAAILWALAAVWVAERADNPPVAWVAVGWAVVVILGGLYLARARRT